MIELLSPAGSMACLKAAVSKGADAVYLGMNKFSARDYAVNFNESYLSEAVKICKSNNVKLYLTMNTLVKNQELNPFFNQLSFAYSKGIDSVIIQETSFVDLIKKSFPDLRVHVSTQAGVMNSSHANLLSKADRITLARELTSNEIKNIRKNFKKELEIFCHGALCSSISGQCLFSSFLGGRSGNRGKCAQPCRKKYNNQYLISTKELCLASEIPEIIKLNVNSIKIEGRMRSPYYVAAATETYRKAIDSYYKGNFKIDAKKLFQVFNREFTKGWFKESKDIFNPRDSSAKTKISNEIYNVVIKNIKVNRSNIKANFPEFKKISSGKKLLVRVYSKEDAFKASNSGADIVFFDILDEDFEKIKISSKLYGVTPRIVLDKDIEIISKRIKESNSEGLLIGNLAFLNLNLPKYLDYNLNNFNDIDLSKIKDSKAIISPELSLNELNDFNNKDFAVLVHGKIRLMTLRHNLTPGIIRDNKGEFYIKKIYNGSEIVNGKELGLLSKSQQLLSKGINQFYIDTENDVENIVKLYRDILDGKKVKDRNIKKNYVIGWAYKRVM